MATAKKRPTRYIVMPQEGFTGATLLGANLQPSSHAVAIAARREAVVRPQMRVIDSIHENGPKLVEMPAEGELSLRLSMPGVKIVPEVFYERQWYRPEISQRPARRLSATAAVAKPAQTQIQVVDRSTGKAVRGAQVTAFTDFAARAGAQGTSGANGQVRLAGISPKQKLERFYVYAPPGYWGYYKTATTAQAQSTVKLRLVDIHDANLLLHRLYGHLPPTAGNGVTVAIIDTGIDGNHPDLKNVSGGLNCVTDETLDNPGAESEWRPAKRDGEHGTHVAGIVAARPSANGFRGVAPGATLRAYRVFPDTGGGASNYDIAKAIDRAVGDRFDILNLSLGGGPADDLTKAAISRALEAGTIVICAAGNEDRSPVAFPAAYPECTAVTALGRRGSFPKDSIGASDIARPFGNPDKAEFVAAFSNFGSTTDCIGAGVEIVSTLPRRQYGPMSGTSMATPAVSGYAAYLLSEDAVLRNSSGADRSRRLKDLLYSNCKPQGLGRDFEGFGLPLP
jgi:subtilisin